VARARNIKPGFFKNEDLAECSLAARLCFAGLWTLADREGRLEDRPKRIKGELFAYDSIEVDPLLGELEAHGFLVRYRNSEGSFIQVSKFSTHQTPHYSEKPSVIKPPSLQETDSDDDQSTPVIHQEDSKKDTPIKDGSQPPDSLIPDSLIPEEEPHTPKTRKSSAIGLKAWLEQVKAKGEKAIPDDDQVFVYADEVGIPADFLRLAWAEFRGRYTEPNAKRYIDWRSVFRKAVRGNWLKLWWVDGQGAYTLTTAGAQAQRMHRPKDAA
jgi:hypothetical protein